jgi:hypothetical protein
MRFLHIALWVLIAFNFFAASLILYIPYSFTHWVEAIASSHIRTEDSILDKDLRFNIQRIGVSGPITGEAELVKKQP